MMSIYAKALDASRSSTSMGMPSSLMSAGTRFSTCVQGPGSISAYSHIELPPERVVRPGRRTRRVCTGTLEHSIKQAGREGGECVGVIPVNCDKFIRTASQALPVSCTLTPCWLGRPPP